MPLASGHWLKTSSPAWVTWSVVGLGDALLVEDDRADLVDDVLRVGAVADVSST